MSEPMHILSLGAGVQSSTLALMAAAGEVTPMPAAAIFADTQAEPASVYQWLDWLEKQLPFPVYRVTQGALTDTSLRVRERVKSVGKPWSKSLIPAHVANSDGSKGIMGRSCTADFKIAPLRRKQKELAGALYTDWKNNHIRWAKAVRAGFYESIDSAMGWRPAPPVVTWIGISLDEVHRMKPSRDQWCQNRWPLIEKEMTRHDCKRWIEARGFPMPPRSACVYCPFHSDHEWRRLRDQEPEEFQKAVQFERDLQAVKKATDNMNGVPFLHASLKPLDQVDFTTDTERGQGDMFGNECEGLCGV